MLSKNSLGVISIAICCAVLLETTDAFTSQLPAKPAFFWALRSTYSVDQSDYSPKDTDYEDDDGWSPPASEQMYADKGDSIDVKELKPVPMSKNAGNRFIAILWDRLLDTEDRSPIHLHEERIQHTEDHIMYCRKSNLYNETFNVESMVDVLWSRQLLSSDVHRVIGQIMCLESTELKFVKQFLKEEPLVQFFTGGDISQIPLYRWRHLRDYTLRQDDGRYGTPCMMLGLDWDVEEEKSLSAIRDQTNETHLEYLIKSERVIAAGPLHLCTEVKDDPSSLPIGDLVMFNSARREEAIQFAENEPRAKQGLYKTLQVHFYNNLDVTGKFVAENRMEERSSRQDMKEALGIWGYPVEDNETPWINW